MEKILISRCFLGEIVRYDAQSKRLENDILTTWQNEGRLVAICPEVAGGLSTPRDPAEIQPTTGAVITNQKINVTTQFQHGAELALALCIEHKLKYALLKESSPSCGSSTIYDGSHSNTKIKGEGVTTALLRKNGIEVFSENEILALKTKIDITINV